MAHAVEGAAETAKTGHVAKVGRPPSGGGACNIMAQARRLAAVWNDYLDLLDRQPLRTKSITAGVLGVVAEIVSRMVREEWAGVISGSLRNLLLGALFRAPMLHLWTGYLNRAYAEYPKTWSTTVRKVIFHELTYDPWFAFTYMTLLRLLSGSRLRDAALAARKELPAAMRAQWRVWPVVQCLNFGYVPCKLQVGFVNIVSIFTNAYLTFLSRHEQLTGR